MQQTALKLQHFLFPFVLFTGHASGQNLPVPDHIVILFLEDKDFTQVAGDTNLPYINSLIADTNTALFTQSYCTFTGYSQPNYLDFYSGDNQGVTNNLVPSNAPFSTENLGRQLMDAGRSFITYAEDLPYAGFNGPTSGLYDRKHNPVTNWSGTGPNQVPDTLSQPFTSYPVWDYDLLPTVSFVIPNESNNMHDGNYPLNFQLADLWVQTHLDAYIQWAESNNSLFILTFDEGSATDRITTLFHGPMVQDGQYSDTISHYSVLRTIEDMYSLGYAGNAALWLPITNCWKTTSVAEGPSDSGSIRISPNPTSSHITLPEGNWNEVEILDMQGRRVYFKDHCESLRQIILNISPGIHTVRLKNDYTTYFARLAVIR